MNSLEPTQGEKYDAKIAGIGGNCVSRISPLHVLESLDERFQEGLTG